MRSVDERLPHADLARAVRRFQAVAGWIRCRAAAAHEFAVLHNLRNCGADHKLTVHSARGSFASIVTRIRGRSLDELRVRSVQALHARLERLWDPFLPCLPTRGTPAPELVFNR